MNPHSQGVSSPVIARFETHFRRLAASLGQSNPRKIAIALSGGSDSLALLHLARVALAPDCHIVALTIDHQLRENSQAEANQVAQWMESLSIEHHILRWNHAPLTQSPQAQARNARYQLLDDYCATHNIALLLTGHTQDDQAETIALMHERGASVVGLAGMSAIRALRNTHLLRPLLGHSRTELQSYLSAQNISWISDPSNEDEAFTRIRIRKELAADTARKTALLSLGKQMATERSAIEHAHAKFVAAHIHSNNNTLHVTRAAWLAYAQHSPAQAAYSMGRMVCHVAGRAYPPRYAKRLNAVQQIQNATQPRFTLARCIIGVTDEQITLSAEGTNQLFGTKPLVTHPFTPI